ncbi:MAG: hypothetical protein J6S96_09265 [Muribaculaceae bacterium]|nr:hypothetical protein [Muribaculaceae bacterium]
MKHLPNDINIELLLTHDCGFPLHVRNNGTHHRNAYGDLASVETEADGKTLLMHLARASIYNALPEYMFHSVDRFSGLDESRDEDAFTDEVAKQARERENALRFFAPFDALLLLLRADVRKSIEKHTVNNNVLQDIIGDRLTDEQRNNRFIRQLLVFLPLCRHIRGNRTLLTIMLRKVLMDEGLYVDVAENQFMNHDDKPRYQFQLGGQLGECFVGNDYYCNTTVFTIHYWNEEWCDEHFIDTMAELEQMRLFIQDWFLGLEQQLQLDVWTDNASAVRLSDTESFNYLNYNASL